jgi:UDP-N-acetylmuramoyl-L-alanyl-D-glutamate--2,6-diaminopimelate ligase
VILEEFAAAIPGAQLIGDGSAEVRSLDYDSRRVQGESLFFCVPGEKVDGHLFAEKAVEAGAVGLVVEHKLDNLEVPQILVPDARAAMAPLAARFYDDPTAKLKVIGVTGTNGKTTTAFLIREILEAVGIQCGLLGTITQVVGGEDEPVERTTPEAIDLQGTFARMLRKKDRVCVMEVSSHALTLHRCDAIHFDIALFTNLTQDHLDFHIDMDDYFKAKRLLFDMGPRVAIANVDDRYGKQLAKEFCDCLTYSATDAKANFVARDVKLNAAGAEFELVEWLGREKIAANALSHPPGGVVQTRLPGAFNVDNALGAFAAATRVDLSPSVEPDAAACALADAHAPPGRLQPIDEGQPFTVLVDYAHTPDSLDNVLKAVREVTEGRVIAVFGAGGDRDRTKRPLMGRAGAEGSDLAVVTSDNPRSEDPAAIVAEVLAGIEDRIGVEAEVDRRAAIALAFDRAEPGDTVVIAGKGHEQGQEFEDGREVPFDDRQVAREELRELLSRGRSGASEPG